MKAIDVLLSKVADSATTRIQSYKGHDDQGHDMGARAVMEKGQPETPRPHKTTQGDISDGETDRFSKGADGRVTAPEIVQPVPVTPSQSVLEAKKIAPASLPTLAKTDGNRMRFGKPYRSTVKTFADKRSAMEKTAQQLTQPQPQSKLGLTPPGSPTLLPTGSTGAGHQPVKMPELPREPGPPPVKMPELPREPGPPPVKMPEPPQSTAGVPLPTLEQQGDPLMNQSAIPGTHPSLESPAAGPQGDSLMPKTEPPAGTPPAKSWGGAWDALKGAWGKLPGVGQGILGGGGIGLLLLLLSKLFGKRGDASYSEEEIERAGNLLDRMSQRQKAALWGEAQARPDEIEKMACNMAKRYSRTHKVGKPPAKRGQFAAGNKFQGVKTAQTPSGAPRPMPTLGGAAPQLIKSPRRESPSASVGAGLPQRPRGIMESATPQPPGRIDQFVHGAINKAMPEPGAYMRWLTSGGRDRTPPHEALGPGSIGATTATFGPVAGGALQHLLSYQRRQTPAALPKQTPAPIAPSSPGQFGAAAAGTIPYHTGGRFPSLSGQIMGPVPGSPTRVGPKVPSPTKPPALGKEGTWVTRNGKRVHIKHKKKRKKSAAEFGNAAAQPGLPGAAAGGAGGLDLATLLKLLLAKANTPSIQDTPGTGIFEPALANAGLGGGPSARQQSGEDMLAELQAKSAQGPPYKGPLTKTSWAASLA